MTTEIRLLGTPSLIKAGRPVRLHSAKTLALLAYLILEAVTPHSREKLAGLLWGESPEARARQSLRQALYSLRRALEIDLLVSAGGAVVLEPHPDLWVDVTEFVTVALSDQSRLDADTLRRTAKLYRGMLLEGLELSDCPEFGEWLFFQRDNLEQRAISMLQTLVDELLHRGGFSGALDIARRLVRLDPLHEGAYRRLMRIHAAQGDLDGVRRQYRICADVLSREMGVKPGSETQSLYRQLTTATSATPLAPKTSPVLHPGEESLIPPFLGRERELAALQNRLEQAATGQGGLMLVTGEAGVGKTRLVEEFIGRNTHVRCLQAQCYEPEAHAPYTMWGDALQPLSRQDWGHLLENLAEVWRRQLARLVPEMGPPADDIEGTTPTESRLRLHQGVLQSLVYLARSGGILLWFDNLQWADEASLELLHYVSRHVATHPLLILGTCRPEATLDASRLDLMLPGISRIPGPSRLDLAPLDKETIGRMLAHLGTEWPGDLPDRLYQLSAGVPFLLVETIRTLAEAGELRRESDGQLLVSEGADWPMPRPVQSLIEARLSMLGEQGRRVLASGAVIGRPFGLRLLRRVSGLPEPEALGAVEQLLRWAFFDEWAGALPESSLDFHHDYLRRVIYEGLSAVQRRALHRRTARALQEFHRARPETVTEEMAYHLERAGDPEAITYLVRAARQAEELFAYGHATDLYDRALSTQSVLLADDVAGCFDLLLAREAVLDRQGRRSAQGKDVAKLMELADNLGDTRRLALACVRQAGFFTYTGQYVKARHVGERALTLYRKAQDTSGETHALRELGFLHWSANDYGSALRYAHEALKVHRRLGDVEGEATALHNLAEIHRGLGSPRQALAQYEAALNLYWARQDRRRQGLTLYGLAHAWRQLGDLDQALTRYQAALDLCQAAGDRLMTSRVHHTLTGLYWEVGAQEKALDHLGRALNISREIGYGPGIAHGLIALCRIQAQRGDLDIARQHLQEAINWLELTEDQAGLAQAQILLRALDGEHPEALDLPSSPSWVKSHVALTEGKVYCEFESPMAQGRS